MVGKVLAPFSSRGLLQGCEQIPSLLPVLLALGISPLAGQAQRGMPALLLGLCRVGAGGAAGSPPAPGAHHAGFAASSPSWFPFKMD